MSCIDFAENNSAPQLYLNTLSQTQFFFQSLNPNPSPIPASSSSSTLPLKRHRKKGNSRANSKPSFASGQNLNEKSSSTRFKFNQQNQDVTMEESGWQKLSSLQTEAMMQIVCGRILKSHPQTVQAVRCTCKAWKQAVQSFGRIRVIRIDSCKAFNIGSQTQPNKQANAEQDLGLGENPITPIEIPVVEKVEETQEEVQMRCNSNPAAKEFASIVREGGCEEGGGTLISLVYLYPSDFIDLKKQDIRFGGPVKVISQHASQMTAFSNEYTENWDMRMLRCGGRKYMQIRMPNQVSVKEHQVEFENVRVSFSYTVTFSTKEEPEDFIFKATNGGKISMTDCQLASKNGFLTAGEDGYVNLERTELATTTLLKATHGSRMDIVDCHGDMFMICNQKGSFINIVNCRLDVLEFPVQQTQHLAHAQGGTIAIKDSVISITVKKCGFLPSDIRPYDSGVQNSWGIFSCSDEGVVSLENVTFKLHDIFWDSCVPDITVQNALFVDGDFTLQNLLNDFGQQQSQ